MVLSRQSLAIAIARTSTRAIPVNPADLIPQHPMELVGRDEVASAGGGFWGGGVVVVEGFVVVGGVGGGGGVGEFVEFAFEAVGLGF